MLQLMLGSSYTLQPQTDVDLIINGETSSSDDLLFPRQFFS
jgi:hypothetical protein